jgi:hypothetical protein
MQVKFTGKIDGVAKSTQKGQSNPIYSVVAHFCSLGIPYVWPRLQKHPTPCISKFSESRRLAYLLGHSLTFCDIIKTGFRNNSSRETAQVADFNCKKTLKQLYSFDFAFKV